MSKRKSLSIKEDDKEYDEFYGLDFIVQNVLLNHKLEENEDLKELNKNLINDVKVLQGEQDELHKDIKSLQEENKKLNKIKDEYDEILPKFRELRHFEFSFTNSIWYTAYKFFNRD